MAQFINDTDRVVTEAIDGLLALRGPVPLARLDGFPHTRVVFRTDADPSRVAVISGGGSGHEPSHSGFVGDGMLTAAVAGDVFASPSVEAVLAGILQVTGDAGCLLVVKNYTGDRLNFGLAAERAKRLGRRVAMVIVTDDIAIEDAPQPRGIAGTLLVHKIAGYSAASGADLDTVHRAAEEAARAVHSIGLSLATCDLPGQPPRSHDSEPELGLGIHGEPGAEAVALQGARDAVARLSERLGHVEGPLALLINNLGSTTPLEMGIVTREVLATEFGQRARLIVGPAPLMTSLNMHGISLSALPLTPEREAALTAAVAPPAWPGATIPGEPRIEPMPDLAAGERWTAEEDAGGRALMTAVCQALIDQEEALNALDARVGDGDTGSTFAAGARAVLAALESPGLPLASPAELMRAVGQILERNMGGSSGVLLSILFTTAGNAARTGNDLPAALRAGAEAVAHYGGANRGDRTLLDALLPALDTLEQNKGLVAVATAAEAAARETGQLTRAGAGRSAYLRSESLGDTPDPGAMAVAHAFRAAAGPSV